MPAIIVKIMNFLSCLSVEEITDKKVCKPKYSPQVSMTPNEKKIIPLRDRKLTDADYKEMDDMRMAKLNYQKVINFEVME